MTDAVRPRPPFRVMIVDDHPVVRAGIAAVLSRDPEFEVCCEAGSEQEVHEKIRAAKAGADEVDLAIIDLSLTSTSGMLFFRHLLNSFPNLRILVLSMHDETVYSEKVLQAGAHGYVMKGETTNSLIEAAHTVLSGRLYVSPRMRDMMLRGVARTNTADARHGAAALSRAELIVLELIGGGATSNEIAAKLNRSVKTVDAHRANIKRKLGLANNNALLCYAMQFVQQNLAA